MSRKRRPNKRGRSEALRVRLWPEEKAGLAQLAEILGETPSRVMRRLLREAINGGPDYFEDGRDDIRLMRRQLTALGRNLNQLIRQIYRGQLVAGEDVRRAVNACNVQVEAVRVVYLRAVEAAAARAWRPLFGEIGVASPFNEQPPSPPDVGRNTGRRWVVKDERSG